MLSKETNGKQETNKITSLAHVLVKRLMGTSKTLSKILELKSYFQFSAIFGHCSYRNIVQSPTKLL